MIFRKDNPDKTAFILFFCFFCLKQKMKERKLLIMFFLGAMACSCAPGGKTAKPAKNNLQEMPKQISVLPGFNPKGKNIAAQVLDIERLETGIIKLIFQYSGGCKEHEFSLVSQAAW